MATSAETLPELLRPLRELLVKDSVAIGGLSESHRRLALALVWTGLPPTVMTEREANEALKTSLASAAVFLGADHVELRRWLVDSGWLTRDGFGRQYQRVDGGALPQSLRALAAAFAGIDTIALAADLRTSRAAERAERRRAWNARQGGTG